MEIVVLQQEFVSKVEAALKSRGWTRSDLSRAMGIGPSMVTDYLNGRKSPGLDVVERFFNALEIQPHLDVSESIKPKRLQSAS